MTPQTSRMTALVKNSNPDTDLSYKIYESTIPDEISGKLDDIYQSPYCVRDYHTIYNSSDDINALVISLLQIPVHILLFTVKDKRVEILNRLYSIDSKYIDYASEAILSKYGNVVRVDFKVIYKTHFGNMRTPHLILNTNRDIILDLPENLEEYCSKLGGGTRYNIKRYSRKLENTLQNVKFEVRIGSNVDSNVVRRIIALHRLRMIKKGQKSYIDKNYEEKICKFSKLYGRVGVITINDKICAGTIFYAVGRHIYLHVISHDAQYDKYDLGIICLFDTIKHCVEIKAQTLHFLWGASEYKHRFLGHAKEVCDIAVFKSNMHKMLNYYEVFACVSAQVSAHASLLFTKLSSNKRLIAPTLLIRKLYCRLARR